ncbi:MAG: DEAD/DEAH box helicase family protein [Clostridiales bacterium]|nr:DEAD/DEAH box helicase family protein [Clostridiales bacterium]
MHRLNSTIHDELTGKWEIPNKFRYRYSVGVTSTYGTRSLMALHILEDTLNMKAVKVTQEVRCPSSKTGVKRVIDKKETVAALDKQQALIKAFRDWVWTDPERKKRLEQIFDERFGSIRRRIYDGSFLTFPTMSPSVTLYPYQKNAVARMIFSANTLLAHDVGSGKTYEMIAAGQELKRMGLSSKNMYVVPNNIVDQWVKIFREMYPDARLLIVEPGSFKESKRKQVLKLIRDEDYDGIIIAHSCFDLIHLSKKCHMEELHRQLQDVTGRARANTRCSSLESKRKKLEKEIIKLRDEKDDDASDIYFDELGITRLFVDEAHQYKNVPIETGVGFVPGISNRASKKCKSMLQKVRYVQRTNDGKGVVMATGTPITNSITDAFVMQTYLQSGELGLLELQNFDSWIGMFAERVTEFEIDVDTSAYRLATRFSKFHNLPELTALLSSIADFHSVTPSSDSGIPTHDGYVDAVLGKTDEFASYLTDISRRADDVRQGRVSLTEDNLLKITTDGRKAALDMRLVDPAAGSTDQCKASRCAENVADIYIRTNDFKGTQLVFCDYSTPKDAFNLYTELKSQLIGYGIPSDEIAFVHDADSADKREKLFGQVRRGEVRILMGSTAKLGLGVNIQDKLVALHHLDVPWRPADMTQREGRILRQGNTNSKVYIYRYITEGSFDAYSWQLLETKQRFITSLLSGSQTERDNDDIDDVVLNYAEVKALAVGNSLVKERVEAANELTRYTTLQNKLRENRLLMSSELETLPSKIDYQRKLIAECEDDIVYSRMWSDMHPMPVDTDGKKRYADQRRGIREIIDNGIRSNTLYTAERTLIKYRGFEVILPSNMTVDKPYVILKRSGRYTVDLGDTVVGNLIRIDNFIDGLQGYANGLRDGLNGLLGKQADITSELQKTEDYQEYIDRYRAKIEELDAKLGVDAYE